MPVGHVTEIIGDEALLALLDELIRPGAMSPAMERIGARLRTELAKYPAPPPDSTYRRTNTLGRGWTHTVQTSLIAATAIIGNNTPYAPEVQGEGLQAEIHKGRWQTEKEVLTDNIDFVMEEVGEQIDQIIAK